MKRHLSILLRLALSLALALTVMFWRDSPESSIEPPSAVNAAATTNPADSAPAPAPAAGPEEDRDLKADLGRRPQQGEEPKPEGRQRAEKILERMREKDRLYAPPKLDREALLAYLRQHPDDAALHVWAAHALREVTLLPDGEDPMILWARLWLPLSGTHQIHGIFALTPDFLATAERLAVVDPGNALPPLLLAVISAKEGNTAGALAFLEAASRLPLNDYSGPLHQAGMEYLAAQGWSPTERLRAKIDYLGSYGVEAQLQNLLRDAAQRTGNSSQETSLLLAARLQLSSVDSAATGIVRMNSKLSEESYAISRLGIGLTEYMPGKSEEEALNYRSELKAAKLESDQLIAVRDLIFEGTSESRAMEFIRDRNALGEVAALRAWSNKPEIQAVLASGKVADPHSIK